MRRAQSPRSFCLAIVLCALAARAEAQIEFPEAPLTPQVPPEGVDLPEKPRGNLAERMLGNSPYRESTAGEQATKARGGLDLPPALDPGAPAPAGATPQTPAGPGQPASIDAAPISGLPPIRT